MGVTEDCFCSRVKASQPNVRSRGVPNPRAADLRHRRVIAEVCFALRFLMAEADLTPILRTMWQTCSGSEVFCL